MSAVNNEGVVPNYSNFVEVKPQTPKATGGHIYTVMTGQAEKKGSAISQAYAVREAIKKPGAQVGMTEITSMRDEIVKNLDVKKSKLNFIARLFGGWIIESYKNKIEKIFNEAINAKYQIDSDAHKDIHSKSETIDYEEATSSEDEGINDEWPDDEGVEVVVVSGGPEAKRAREEYMAKKATKEETKPLLAKEIPRSDDTQPNEKLGEIRAQATEVESKLRDKLKDVLSNPKVAPKVSDLDKLYENLEGHADKFTKKPKVE